MKDYTVVIVFSQFKQNILTNYKPIKFIVVFLLFITITTCSETQANQIENNFKQAGLIDLQDIDPTITVKLVNSNSLDNYFGTNFYQGLKRAYLHKAVALKLAHAQKKLHKKHPTYSLQIMDAARPYSVSVQMYQQVQGTAFEKFVANPKGGSMHNYGAAVDVTIIDKDGQLLDMGMIPFYKPKPLIIAEYLLTKNKKLTKIQKINRQLLKECMLSSGFRPLNFEWWHFNGFSKAVIRKKYKMIK